MIRLSSGYEEVNTYYYHTDHLGSAQLIADYEGEQYEHIEYTPYGELWIEDTSDDFNKIPFRFTGKEFDDETGLYYYGARYLNPRISRWASADPAGFDLINPMNEEFLLTSGLNWYCYSENNPVKYKDPDGNTPLLFTKKAQKKINTSEPYIRTEDVQKGYPTYRGINKLGLEKKRGQQKGVTWCNRALNRIVEAFGGDTSLFLDKKGIGWTKANKMAQNLKKAAKKGKVTELNGRFAQLFADLGFTVVATWENPNPKKSGHVATVVGDNENNYDPEKGPKIVQAGEKNGSMYTVEGFTKKNLDNVKYYLVPKKAKEK